MTITRRQLAARFVDALGSRPLPELAAGLMEAAIAAGHGRQLESLITTVEYELQARYGAVEVRLTTAHELPAAALDELASRVAAIVGASSHSSTHRVDAELIGGFEAEAGDSVTRGSIRSNLTSLGAHNG